MGVSHGGVYAANSTDMNSPGLDKLDLMSVGCFLNTNTMVLVDISLPHSTLLSFSLASSLFGIPSCRYNFSRRSTVR